MHHCYCNSTVYNNYADFVSYMLQEKLKLSYFPLHFVKVGDLNFPYKKILKFP
jgi:hypothetical protein